MKNLMKAIGMAVIVSGVFAVSNVSAQTTPATAAPAKTTQAAPAKATTTTTPAKTADKVVGKDAKGQNIYEGPKGGKYTLDAKGAKHYLPKEAPKAATTPATTTPAPKK